MDSLGKMTLALFLRGAYKCHRFLLVVEPGKTSCLCVPRTAALFGAVSVVKGFVQDALDEYKIRGFMPSRLCGFVPVGFISTKFESSLSKPLGHPGKGKAL
jgi:hypothetical protein